MEKDWVGSEMLCDECSNPMTAEQAIILWREDVREHDRPDQWVVAKLVIVHRGLCHSHSTHASTPIEDMRDVNWYRAKFSKQPFDDEAVRQRALSFLSEVSKTLPEVKKPRVFE
jgi:hypothetical protein